MGPCLLPCNTIITNWSLPVQHDYYQWGPFCYQNNRITKGAVKFLLLCNRIITNGPLPVTLQQQNNYKCGPCSCHAKTKSVPTWPFLSLCNTIFTNWLFLLPCNNTNGALPVALPYYLWGPSCCPATLIMRPYLLPCNINNEALHVVLQH